MNRMMLDAQTLPAGVADFLEEQTDAEPSLQVVTQQLANGNLTVLNLVKALGAVLTSEVDATRCRGTLLLAEAVARAPAALVAATEVRHLALFFAGRLADFPCLRPALQGCLALAQRTPAACAPPVVSCTPEDAAGIAEALLGVHVRGLAVGERQLCLQLMSGLVEGYGDILAGSPHLRALQGATTQLDGERDPRCLLAAFANMAALTRLYWRQSAASRQVLEEHAEEMVEVLACYFPIVYTPPPGAPGVITRAELVSGVEAALAAAPTLAPHVIPLILEKLSSSLRQAIVDALSALAACSEGFGPEPMQAFLPQVWDGLRSVLLAPAEPNKAAEEKAEVEERAELARGALRRCVRELSAAGDSALARLVLGDGFVEDMLGDLADPSGQSGGPAGAAARVAAATGVLAAVAGASLSASALVCKRMLGSLIRAASSAATEPPPGGALALGAILAVVRATRECLTLYQPEDSALAKVPPAVHGEGAVAAEDSAVGPTEPVLAGRGTEVLHAAWEAETPDEASISMHSEAGQLDAEGLGLECWKVRLELVGQLASFPSSASPLRAPELEQALQFLLRSICDPPNLPDQPSPGGQESAANGDSSSAVAVDALAAMLEQGRNKLLAQQALPQLLQAASSCSSSSSSEQGQRWRGQGALAALSRIAVASGDLCGDVRSALVDTLADCLARPDVDQDMLRGLLETLASESLVAPASGPGSASEADIAFVVLHGVLSDSLIHWSLDTLKAAATLVSHAMAHNSAGQLAIAQMATAFLAAQREPTGTRHGWQLAQRTTVCSAAIAALPAGFQGVGGSAEHVPTILLSTALHILDDTAARSAADAAAALLNKTGAGLVVESMVGTLLHDMLLPHMQAHDALALRSCMCCGALSRALAMRGHAGFQDAVFGALSLLEELSGAQASPAQEGCTTGLVTLVDAARTFEALLSGDSAAQLCAWEQGPGVITKPLWQQRAFSATACGLLQRLHSASGQAGNSGSLQHSSALLLGLGRLIRGAPPAVVRAQLEELLPAVLEALGGAAMVDDAEVATALLLTLSEALIDPTGQRLLEEHLGALVQALLHQALSAHTAATRVTALECLLAAVGLPYHLLHQHRGAVLSTLGQAVDDPKRAVRMAAVCCRRAWSTM